MTPRLTTRLMLPIFPILTGCCAAPATQVVATHTNAYLQRLVSDLDSHTLSTQNSAAEQLVSLVAADPSLQTILGRYASNSANQFLLSSVIDRATKRHLTMALTGNNSDGALLREIGYAGPTERRIMDLHVSSHVNIAAGVSWWTSENGYESKLYFLQRQRGLCYSIVSEIHFGGQIEKLLFEDWTGSGESVAMVMISTGNSVEIRMVVARDGRLIDLLEEEPGAPVLTGGHVTIIGPQAGRPAEITIGHHGRHMLGSENAGRRGRVYRWDSVVGRFKETRNDMEW